MPAALAVRGVSKRFGATQALRNVDFTLAPGRVHALLGGNGSGKSTMVKILAGAYQADSGTIARAGREWAADEYDASTARSTGLRFVHQTLAQFPSLTVAENIALARGYPTHRSGRVDWPRIVADAEQLLDRYGMATLASMPVGHLRPAAQALVAIASALGTQSGSEVDSSEPTPHILVVDEATAALPRGEADDLMSSLRQLAGDGHAVLFISHRIDEVLAVADDITVLRDGQVAEQCQREGLTHETLVDLLAGASTSRVDHTPPSAERARTRLRVDGLGAGVLRSIDVEVAGGEILGISGLLGSGRSTLLHAIFDPEQRARGTVTVDGSPLVDSPARAMDAGVALVPEDRSRQAVFDGRSVADNLTEAMSKKYWRRGWLSTSRTNADAREMVTRHGIVTASERAPIGSLSGGNQQKVVLTRWLERRPAVLLLDEPTQGVDVHARRSVHDAIRDAVNDGACAVLASSDLDELIELSDRIVVLANGGIVAELHPPFEPERLLALEQTSLHQTSLHQSTDQLEGSSA